MKEGWIYENVHRLPFLERGNHQEQVPFAPELMTYWTN